MGYDTTIYIAIRCHTGSPRNTRQINTNSRKTHHLVAVFSCFFRLCVRPHLGLSSVWPFSSCFCCPSDGHIIGLTVPSANSNLVPSGLGLLPEHVRLFLFHFSFFFLFFSFFPCLFSFLIPGTWYSIVVARYPGT